MLDKVYAIFHKTRNEAYVGRTRQDIQERFKQHLRDAGDLRYEKRLAEALRHEPDEWFIGLCEESETASEAEWMARFEADGWTLLNSVGGNRAQPRERDTFSERRWRELNAEGFKAKSDGNGSAGPNRYVEICAIYCTSDPWARFAAANPDCVQLLRQELAR